MPLVARHTSEPLNGSEPPAELLPAVGDSAPARPPAPARALADEALRLQRRLVTAPPLPGAWARAGFAREVTLVRTHLALIRSRAALTASYSREAFHAVADPTDVPGAVRVAYAIRWLEIGEGCPWPAWPMDAPEPGPSSSPGPTRVAVPA
jgi:hypothetical protein